jgi:hypothetical protein
MPNFNMAAWSFSRLKHVVRPSVRMKPIKMKIIKCLTTGPVSACSDIRKS